MTKTDVVVIGVGMAGAQACLTLAELGFDVLAVEARDEIGGRAMHRPLGESGYSAELGGGWVMPTLQPMITAAMKRHGIGTVDGPPADRWRWLLSMGRRDGGNPLTSPERRTLLRAMSQAKRDARALKRAIDYCDYAMIDGMDASILDWLRARSLAPAVEDILMAFIGNSANVEPAEGSIIGPLWGLVDYGGDPWLGYSALNSQIDGGTTALVESVVRESGCIVRTNSAVVAVDEDRHGVRVHLSEGDVIHARGAVVTVPVNSLSHIRLPATTSKGLRSIIDVEHPGRGVKVWAVVRGVAGFPFILDAAGPLRKLRCADNDGDRALIVGIGNNVAVDQLLDPDYAQRVFAGYLGDHVQVESVHAHDWLADPYSRGGWYAVPVGRASEMIRYLAEPDLHHRVRFAGSDLAPRWHGWIEGALLSGRQEAQALAVLLDATPSLL